MDNEEKRRKTGREVKEAMESIRRDLIDKGIDLEELRKDMLEELDIMRSTKAAEKATKH